MGSHCLRRGSAMGPAPERPRARIRDQSLLRTRGPAQYLMDSGFGSFCSRLVSIHKRGQDGTTVGRKYGAGRMKPTWSMHRRVPSAHGSHSACLEGQVSCLQHNPPGHREHLPKVWSSVYGKGWGWGAV